MTEKQRKSIEQQIADATAKLDKLKAKQKNLNSELTAESNGMDQLIEMVTTVAKTNKVKVSDVVIAIAKIKKTMLKIESTKRKPKTVGKSTLDNSKE